MKKNIFTYLSNITLITGAALGGYVLIDFMILKSRIPEGACPLTENKTIIYAAIAFLLMSFIFSVLEQKQKKKAQRERQEEINEKEKTDSEEA